MQAVSIHPPPTYHTPYPDKQIITKRNLTHIHNHIIIVLALQSYTITSITPNIFSCSKTYNHPSRLSLFSTFLSNVLRIGMFYTHQDYLYSQSFINVYPLGAIHIFACYGREHRCLPIGRKLHKCLPIRRTFLYLSGANILIVYPLGAHFFTNRAHKCLPVRRTNVYPLGAQMFTR